MTVECRAWLINHHPFTREAGARHCFTVNLTNVTRLNFFEHEVARAPLSFHNSPRQEVRSTSSARRAIMLYKFINNSQLATASEILLIGLQPIKTRAEMDSSTVYLKQIFYEYHRPLKFYLTIYRFTTYQDARRVGLVDGPINI